MTSPCAWGLQNTVVRGRCATCTPTDTATTGLDEVGEPLNRVPSVKQRQASMGLEPA